MDTQYKVTPDYPFSTVYIIGNGFDLLHSLPTRYKDFYCYLQHNCPDFCNKMEEYFHFKTDSDYRWTDFENDLSTFDWRGYFDCHNELDLSSNNFKYSEFYCLEDEMEIESQEFINHLRSRFSEWVQEVDLENIKPNITIHSNAFFITFNYTRVLQDVYKVRADNVLHLHGSIDHDSSELIFGHNGEMVTEPEFDDNGEPTNTPFTDSESKSGLSHP